MSSGSSAEGSRLRCVAGRLKQIDDIRSGASYASQNDLCVHFGLGKITKAGRIEIRRPSGQVDVLKNVESNQLVYADEGIGIVRKVSFPPK